MSAPSPALRRALYRGLLRAASALDAQLCRCEPLRAREVALLQRSQRLPATAARPTASAAVRVASRAVAPADTSAMDAGLRAYRHLSRRAAALGRLVYDARSEAVTDGVRVAVSSEFSRYEPASRRWCFQYHVQITNEGAESVRLVGRRWEIADLNGRREEVEGLGVVGEFPELSPGESYEYHSLSPLATAVGTQRGHFLFVSGIDPGIDGGDTVAGSGGGGAALAREAPPARALLVRIAPFGLLEVSSAREWCALDDDEGGGEGGDDDGGEGGGEGGGGGGREADGGWVRGRPAAGGAEGGAAACSAACGTAPSGSKLRGPGAGVASFPRGRRARRPRPRRR
jgi:ApaG protein